jgi:hypothetical protein
MKNRGGAMRPADTTTATTRTTLCNVVVYMRARIGALMYGVLMVPLMLQHDQLTYGIRSTGAFQRSCGTDLRARPSAGPSGGRAGVLSDDG